MWCGKRGGFINLVGWARPLGSGERRPTFRGMFLRINDRYEIEKNEWEVVNPRIGPNITPNLSFNNMYLYY